jgi:enoyl-CoA hydratase/carnithine racemase
MNEDIRRVEQDNVLTIVFNRDSKLNALTDHMIDELRRAAADLGDRPDLSVMVIRAAGRYFTAGMDIGGLAASVGEADGSGSALRRSYRRLHLLFDELESIEKPIVLAAHAPCFGVGVELGASCDFRIASEAAAFALPEVPNLGVIPGSGGISRVTRLIGPHWVKWLVMAGRTVDAASALQIGFVHAVHPQESFDDEVDAFVQTLARLPHEAVGVAKLAIDATASMDRGTARDFERLANSVLAMSDEHQALVRRFQERGQRAAGPGRKGSAVLEGSPQE